MFFQLLACFLTSIINWLVAQWLEYFQSRVSHTINLIWSQDPKTRFSKNENKIFIQTISVVNFNMIGPSLGHGSWLVIDFFTLPQRFRTKRVGPRTQKTDFEKIKKIPQVFIQSTSVLQIRTKMRFLSHYT